MTSRQKGNSEKETMENLKGPRYKLIIGLDDELSKNLKRLEGKIEAVEAMLKHLASRSHRPPTGLTVLFGETINTQLLSLPDSLRQSMFVMGMLKEASASQVARVTGRSRSAESFHLNQLERMGYLLKYRRGKRIYFKIPKSMNRNGESKTHT